MVKGFKGFLMQGNLIVIAVGLVVALAFSTLIKAFTDNIITPLVNAAGRRRHNRARIHRERPAGELRGVHLSPHLLRDLYGGDLLRPGCALPGLHGQARRPRFSVIHRPPRPARTASRATSRWRRRSAATARADSKPRRRRRAVLRSRDIPERWRTPTVSLLTAWPMRRFRMRSVFALACVLARYPASWSESTPSPLVPA